MPYAYLAAAMVFMVALAGAGYQGYRLGGNSVRAEYQARDAKQAAENEAKELSQAKAQSAISENYEKRLANAENQKSADVAAVRRGALRLYDNAAQSESCQAAGAASGRDGGTEGRLSGVAAEFLLAEAARADAVAEQLAACQAVIRADRN